MKRKFTGSTLKFNPEIFLQKRTFHNTSAISLRPKLDFSLSVLGIAASTPLLSFIAEQQVLNPRALILTQVGSFFRGVGLCSLFLMEYCHLRPMGSTSELIAGIPSQCVQRVLDLLLAEDFTVAVFVEYKKNFRTFRKFEQLISPVTPELLYSITSTDDTYRSYKKIAAAVSEKHVLIIDIANQTFQHYKNQPISQVREILTKSDVCEIIYANFDLKRKINVEKANQLLPPEMRYHTNLPNKMVEFIAKLYQKEPVDFSPIVFNTTDRPIPLTETTCKHIGIFGQELPSLVTGLIGVATGVVKALLSKWLANPFSNSQRSAMCFLRQNITDGTIRIPKKRLQINLIRFMAQLQKKGLPNDEKFFFQFYEVLQRVSLQMPETLTTLGTLNQQTVDLEALFQLQNYLATLVPTTSHRPTNSSKNLQQFFDHNLKVFLLDRTGQENIQLLKTQITKLTQEGEVQFCSSTNQIGLKHANSRINKPISTSKKIMYTNQVLLDLCCTFVTTCDIFMKNQTEMCDHLSRKLFSVYRSVIQFTVTADVALEVIYKHTLVCGKKKWNFVPITAPGTQMHFLDLYPYWIDQAITNDFKLDSSAPIILGAPNTAGKSCILRAVMVASLLANLGMLVPCAPGSTCPYFNSYHLKLPSSDLPEFKLSSFEREVAEVSLICAQSTAYSLICLDELASGTKYKEAATFCLGLIKHLKGYLIFSTHNDRVLNSDMKKIALSIDINHKLAWNETYLDCNAYEICVRNEIPADICETLKQVDHKYFESALCDNMANSLEKALTLISDYHSYTAEVFDSLLPPKFSGVTGLYILECDEEGDILYVGETSDLCRRQKEHFTNNRSKRIAVIPLANKTEALQMEVKIINLLLAHDLRLEHVTDNTHVFY